MVTTSTENSVSAGTANYDGIVTNESNRVYIRAANLKKYDTIIGTYKGSSVTEKFGTMLHVLQTASGKEAAINGCTDLDEKFAQITPGVHVKLKYSGEQTFKRDNGRDATAHQFWMEVAESEGGNYQPILRNKRDESAASGNSFRNSGNAKNSSANK